MDYMLSTQANVPHSVPVAMLDLPAEPFNAPERWTRFHYPGIVQYTRGDSGGHFPALEKPELLAGDIAKFVRAIQEH